MVSRFKYKWEAPIPQSCPIKVEYELVNKIHPLSFNDDKSVKEYVEEDVWVKRESRWSDYIKSFDIGSISEQVMNHLKKGTPLITAHTLPHGDYTHLDKGAEIIRLMREKGITLDMLSSALSSDSSIKEEKVVKDEKVVKKDGD